MYLTCFVVSDILCLKDVKLTLEPSVVKLKGTSTLRCTYDLEGDKLYSVKWYRGSHEFYRYDVTAESPSRYFEMAGTKPDVSTAFTTRSSNFIYVSFPLRNHINKGGFSKSDSSLANSTYLANIRFLEARSVFLNRSQFFCQR